MPQPEWEDIERRVARLEKMMGVEQSAAPSPASPSSLEPAPIALINAASLPTILGRALLGLAGAYFLRTLTESGAYPISWGVAIGVLYANSWLFWAARTPTVNRLEAAIHSLTAVLVFGPLIWEATLDLHAIPTRSAAALLVLFAFFGLGVSWHKNLLTVATIVTLACLATAAGLLIATRDVVPFTLVFLCIAAAVETSACLEHFLNERWLVALAADLAVLLATWLVTREHGLPEGYAAIPHGALMGMQTALLAIYLGSIIVRTLLRGLSFTTFETAQCAAAFAIAVGGGLQLSGEAHAIAFFALACSAACYLVSFAVMERAKGSGRNFYTYTTFAILLALAGTRLLLGDMAAAAIWCLLALACIGAAVAFDRLTLMVHGTIYLLLALASSGALAKAAAFTLGAAHWSPENPATVWAGLAVSGLCYWIALRAKSGDSVAMQALRLATAGAVVWLAAGASAAVFTAGSHAAFGDAAGHPYCAALRTCVLAALSLLLAWSGTRWSRAELSRLVYPAMLLGAYRLTVIDWTQDPKPALFLSLLVFGGVLVTLPKLTRRQIA